MGSAGGSVRRASAALAAGGALLTVASLLHPRGEAGVAQLSDPLWTPAHVLLLVSLALLGVSLLVLVRMLAPVWRRPLRVAAWAAVVALALSTVESVPHLLAVLEADAAAGGGPAPLYNAHAALERLTNVLLGFTVAALSAAGASRRALGGGGALAALGVIGGVAFGLANPLFAITARPAVLILFDGGILIGLWFLASGLLLARRTAAADAPRAAGVPAS